MKEKPIKGFPIPNREILGFIMIGNLEPASGILRVIIIWNLEFGIWNPE
jgi:hypothetical protein